MAKDKSKEVVTETTPEQLAEAEAQAKVEQTAKEKAEAEAQAKAEQEAKEKAETEPVSLLDGSKPVTVGYSDEAKKLMKQQNVKEIWRCSVTGYWFSRKDYADDQKKRTGASPEHYKL